METRLKNAVKLFNELTLGKTNSAFALMGRGFINGKWVLGENSFEVYNPATGTLIGYCYETTKDQIDLAFKAATQAQFRWQHFVSPQEKRSVFRKLRLLLKRNEEGFTTLFTYESGKILPNSRADIVESEDAILAAHNTLHDDDGTIEPAQLTNKWAGTLPWAYKVELGIKPWNFIAIYFWKMATSVMAGSAVIIKEAEQIPYSAMCMTALFHQALKNVLGSKRAEKLGGLVQLIQGTGETTGRYAVESGTYDMLSATGSWRMGSEVASMAGKKIRPQRLELSGVNRILQWYDYPIEKAADEIALSGFGDSGQRCVSLETAIIPKTLFKQTLQLVIERAKKLRIGDPQDPETTLGPIISKEQLESITNSVEIAKKQGYVPTLGGYPLNPATVDRALKDGFNFNPEDFRKEGKLSEGYWYVPTIFVHLPFYYDIMRYEVFGPVIVLNELEWTYADRTSPGSKAWYKNESDFWIDEYMESKDLSYLPNAKQFLQGMALLNDNLFGLSCGFLSYDMRFIPHFLHLAEYGLRYAGRGTTGAEVDDDTIFGGGKNSGYGREGGSVKYARTKAQFYLDFHGTTRLAQKDE